MLIAYLLQIKNAIKIAVALAIKDRALVSYSYLKVVIEFIKEFNKEIKGPSQDTVQTLLCEYFLPSSSYIIILFLNAGVIFRY